MVKKQNKVSKDQFQNNVQLFYKRLMRKNRFKKQSNVIKVDQKQVSNHELIKSSVIDRQKNHPIIIIDFFYRSLFLIENSFKKLLIKYKIIFFNIN